LQASQLRRRTLRRISPRLSGFALTDVIQEVALADGSGTVPVQFEVSDFSHGPEGPAEELRPTVAADH